MCIAKRLSDKLASTTTIKFFTKALAWCKRNTITLIKVEEDVKLYDECGVIPHYVVVYLFSEECANDVYPAILKGGLNGKKAQE